MTNVAVRPISPSCSSGRRDNGFRRGVRPVGLLCGPADAVAIESGRINAAEPITEAVLTGAGLVRGGKVDGVRLLASGEIGLAINVTVSGASAAAIAAVQAAGGSVTTTVAAKAPKEA